MIPCRVYERDIYLSEDELPVSAPTTGLGFILVSRVPSGALPSETLDLQLLNGCPVYSTVSYPYPVPLEAVQGFLGRRKEFFKGGSF